MIPFETILVAVVRCEFENVLSSVLPLDGRVVAHLRFFHRGNTRVTDAEYVLAVAVRQSKELVNVHTSTSVKV